MKLISFLNYLKDQYFLSYIYYKKYRMPVFELYKYVDYFREYDKWVDKLNLLDNLRILDIGSDYGSLFYYLKVKGFNIIEYKIFDYLIFKSFTWKDYYNLFIDYDFIKIDCEGCEYEIFSRINVNLLDENKIYAVALHKNEFYDERVYNEVRKVCPYRIFVFGDGIEEIYTNKIKKGGIE
jgi:hypothetical protein